MELAQLAQDNLVFLFQLDEFLLDLIFQPLLHLLLPLARLLQDSRVFRHQDFLCTEPSAQLLELLLHRGHLLLHVRHRFQTEPTVPVLITGR